MTTTNTDSETFTTEVVDNTDIVGAIKRKHSANQRKHGKDYGTYNFLIV